MALRQLRTYALLFCLPALTSACVSTPAGRATADPVGQEGERAFYGLAVPRDDVSARYVFMTHGMGPTEPTFGDRLISRFQAAGFAAARRWTGSDNGWIPVELPKPVHISGEALDCASGNPPCTLQNFGGYKIDKLQRGNETLFVYRYYWDPQLRAIQEPFVKNDNDPGKLPRSKLAGPIKHQIINYGFTDAAAYLGPFGNVMRQGAEGAICSMMKHAAAGEPPASPSGPCTFAELETIAGPRPVSFSFVAQSLGSRLIFDTLNPAYNRETSCGGQEALAKQFVARRTDTFFMLANQLPLLALGQVHVRDDASRVTCTPSVSEVLKMARSPDQPFGVSPMLLTWPELPPLQIVSFQDPEDLLGFRFTDQLVKNNDDKLDVVQVTHRNTPVMSAIGYTFSDPRKPHARELEVDTAARLIMCGATFGKGGELRPTVDCLRH